MLNKRITTYSLVLTLMLSLSLSACLYTGDLSNVVRKATRNEALPTVPGYVLPLVGGESYSFDVMKENNQLSLEYDKMNDVVQILDKRNGYAWLTGINAKDENIKVNELWNQNLSSLFYVTYCNIGTNGQMKSTTVPIRKLQPSIWVTSIADGIQLEYYMTGVKLGFSVEFTLSEDTLSIHIPSKSVREDGNILFVRLDVAPLLGSTIIGDNGYYLLPDGSGSLFSLNSSKYDTSYRWDAYSNFYLDDNHPDKLNTQKDSIESKYVNIFKTPLPVYGVKHDNNAFVAFASEGDSDYSITATTGSKNVQVNRIYGQFVMRHSYSFNGIEMGSGSDKALVYEIVDDYFIDEDRTISYQFLCGDQADYNGMAGAYREYLVDAGFLPKVNKTEGVPLVLNIFMGARETGILSGSFAAMTTFDNVREILTELKLKGIDNIIVNLRGWNNNGYQSFNLSYSPDFRLGGKKGLKNLSDYCNDNNIFLSLETDFVNITDEYASMNLRSAFIKNAADKIATDSSKKFYLLNPVKSLDQLTSFLYSSTKNINVGLTLSGMDRLYPDYRDNSMTYRFQTKEIWQKMMTVTAKSSQGVIVSGGNLYTLNEAMIVTDLPIANNSAAISEKAIPFMQLVLHGHVTYSATYFNSFYDDIKQPLRNLEYGAIPIFELTYEPVYKLRNTDYNKVFSASFNEWKDRIIDCYQKYEKISSLFDSEIIKHEQLDEKLVKITYSNGNCLYINYHDEAITVGDITISENNFIVVSKS